MKTFYKLKAPRPYSLLFFALFFSFVFTAGVAFCSVSKNLQVKDVQISGRPNPLGVQTLTPTISWQLYSEQRGVTQQAYRIRVASQSSFVDTSIVWDSQWIATEQSLFHEYAGKSLQSGTTYYVQIEVKDNFDRLAQSEMCYFHTGLYQEEDWDGAQWISNVRLPDSLVNPLPLSSSKLRLNQQYELPVFRKNVQTKKKVSSSYAYISGLGQYEFMMNGHLVDDAVLQPGWTKYDKEAYYVVYDVTEFWKLGKNTLGVMLGNGFYYIPPIKGRYQKHKVAFGLPKLMMKLVVNYDDGTRELITTDGTWKVHRSPITFSSMYGGEDYDANVLPADWSSAKYDDSAWQYAMVVDGPAVVAQEIFPTKVMERFAPKKKNFLAEKKSTVYDFGQNASGIVAVELLGNPGDTVRIYPGELLDSNGQVTQKHTGSPHYYQYVFGPDQKTVSWKPRFTYYGFRYAEVFCRPAAGNPTPEVRHIQSEHIRNSTAEVGQFQSSDILFNQIHELIRWGIKSNMVSLFTDCPHREKLGWLEQLHLMGPSIQYNFDAQALFSKSLYDMRLSQTNEGLVPEIAPEYVQFDWGGDMFRDSPEWGSSAVLLAWYAYRWYGDKSFLVSNYPMMKRYMTYLEGKANENILYQGLSDWYDIGPERPGVSQLTPAGITATAIYYYDLEKMVAIADILGFAEDKSYYDSLKNEAKTSFNTTFYNKEKGWYGTGSQTAQAMALYMGLTDGGVREQVMDHLIEDIVQRDTSFTAGDIGHRYLIQTLAQQGENDLIYAMHRDDTRPGYGYQIKKGATALTESWAALPNVSNNHLMLGHLMEWLYAGIGGIRQDESSVAYKSIVIEPILMDHIERAVVSFQSPYGRIAMSRYTKDGAQKIEVDIPANTSARIVLPRARYQVDDDLAKIGEFEENGHMKTFIEVGSGKYSIDKIH